MAACTTERQRQLKSFIQQQPPVWFQAGDAQRVLSGEIAAAELPVYVCKVPF